MRISIEPVLFILAFEGTLEVSGLIGTLYHYLGFEVLEKLDG
jgi:hypothetical protein